MDYKYIVDHTPVRKTFGQYTKLTSDGSFWIGNCPLCIEDDNNFLVSTEKRLFYCFACHDHGTAIDFIAKIENIGVKAAAQQLINMWGLQVQEPGAPVGLTDHITEIYGPIFKKLAKT